MPGGPRTRTDLDVTPGCSGHAKRCPPGGSTTSGCSACWPDAWCSPGREHVRNGACHRKGSSKTAPGREYQFTAAAGHLRTAWAALADVARTTPPTRTAQTIAQVKNVLRRLCAAGHGAKAAPLFGFDAGYSAAALAGGLQGARPASWSGSPSAACSTPSRSPVH